MSNDQVKTPSQLADQAAEAVRSLNHATLSKRPGWEYPSDAYDVVGGLARVAMMLPQALQQAGRFVDDIANNGHMGVDAGGPDVAAMQTDLAVELTNAVNSAQVLYLQLSRAHAVLSHATYTGHEDEWDQLPGVTDSYPSTAISDNAEHVEEHPDDVQADGRTYQLTRDHAVVNWGDFRQIRAAVAGLVTELLAHDERYALDAQTVNLAFNTGSVQEALNRDGEWSTVFGTVTGKPHTLKVTTREDTR